MKPIFINASPNTQFNDAVVSKLELLRPWRWRSAKLVKNFELEVEKYFGNEIKAVGFDSARSSFYQILKAWGVGPGDEVIVPAFTCTVIVNPILWCGATPTFIDINKTTLNVEISNLKSQITNKTRVILAQHTFGNPLPMEEIMQFAREKGIKVVEDCAHSLGGKYKGQYLGTFGDAAVITFGISKVISGVRGGMVITKDKELYEKLKKMQSDLPKFPWWHSFKFIMNPIVWQVITPIYYLGFKKFTLGKLLVAFLQKIGILSIDNIVEPCENFGQKPNWLPAQMSGSLAVMGQKQFRKLDEMNEHRKKLAQIYAETLGDKLIDDSIYVRYPLFVEDKYEVLDYFRRKRIILGDWYKSILHIPEENYKFLKYTKGECPNAEYAAKHLVNLPTFIKVGERDAEVIGKFAKQFQKNL